ncbi:MAG: hypothetical protein E7381_00280 [Clostridiales bacterium]|nr:hypothetical protein [Clostridiales bacterium]
MYLLVFVSAIFLFLNNLGGKTNKSEGAGNILNITLVVGAASLASWLICLITKQSVTKDMFLFAGIFAVLFITGMIAMYKAYTCGSMSATSLFGNASLVVVVLFSALYFGDTMNVFKIIGVIGVLVSLTLLTLPEKSKDKQESVTKQPFNIVWLLLCLYILFINSAISIAGKFRQTQVGGANPFAYMALCYTMTFVLGIVAYAIMQCKKNTLKTDFENVKQCIPSLAMQTIGNAGSNLLVTFLSTQVNGAILYPVNSGVGLILTVLCSFIFFHEKKTWLKILGIVLGVVAIVLLNL